VNAEILAAVSATSTARHSHHEAGHAVAAVARGGHLIEVLLGTADWSRGDDANDTPGFTRHVSEAHNQPFITYAGPWAEAMWTATAIDAECDFGDAFGEAWSSSDATKYDAYVAGEDWDVRCEREAAWDCELEGYWPVIQQVAAFLVAGVRVDHQIVDALVSSSLTSGAV
jgi:hypothetical protein